MLFLIELARPSIANDWALLGYAQFTAGGPMQGIAAGQWYRLITSAFLPPAGGGLGGLGLLRHRVQHVGAVGGGAEP